MDDRRHYETSDSEPDQPASDTSTRGDRANASDQRGGNSPETQPIAKQDTASEPAGEQPEQTLVSAEPGATMPRRTSRDVLYGSIGVRLLNAGVRVPAAEFVTQIRNAAGYRVSPRQIATAIAELERAGQPVDADAVTQLVQGFRGVAAERQRRHADAWRALGAALALRDLDGSPNGQRAFIGAARHVAGHAATDLLLLTVALAIAASGRALDAELVGHVSKRLAASAPDLTTDAIATRALVEARAIERLERRARPTQRSSSAARRAPASPQRPPGAPERKPGKRRWAPGGRRRRTIRFPEKL